MNSQATQIPEAVLDQALEWQVTLSSGECSEQDKEAFKLWLIAHPTHAETWNKLTDNLGKLSKIPAALTRNVQHLANQELQRRRQWLKSVGALLITGTSAFALSNTPQSKIHLAQYRTTKGEIRTLELPDGSSLTLNSASAVGIHFTSQVREVVLHTGEIQLLSAKQSSTNPAPLQVRVREGVTRAIGTRFTVKRHSHYSLGSVDVAVQEGMVEVSPKILGAQPLRLKAGEAVQFDSHKVGTPATIKNSAHAWTKGLLIAERQSLCNFLKELQRHRPGVIRCDPAVADLLISGVFPLNNTDYVLETVANTLPVQIRQLTPYWTIVEHRSVH
ncbi:FecR domain-containing protein [Limnobacter sp.]|uniref:FecR domain-containing protein n=1 Tax=Limnobacter sp. TaxID=2003368 RepID=UPI0037496ED6